MNNPVSRQRFRTAKTKRFTEEDYAEMKRMHYNGKTMQYIANQKGCSVGYVSKVISGKMYNNVR